MNWILLELWLCFYVVWKQLIRGKRFFTDLKKKKKKRKRLWHFFENNNKGFLIAYCFYSCFCFFGLTSSKEPSYSLVLMYFFFKVCVEFSQWMFFSFISGIVNNYKVKKILKNKCQINAVAFYVHCCYNHLPMSNFRVWTVSFPWDLRRTERHTRCSTRCLKWTPPYRAPPLSPFEFKTHLYWITRKWKVSLFRWVSQGSCFPVCVWLSFLLLINNI